MAWKAKGIVCWQSSSLAERVWAFVNIIEIAWKAKGTVRSAIIFELNVDGHLTVLSFFLLLLCDNIMR